MPIALSPGVDTIAASNVLEVRVADQRSLNPGESFRSRSQLQLWSACYSSRRPGSPDETATAPALASHAPPLESTVATVLIDCEVNVLDPIMNHVESDYYGR